MSENAKAVETVGSFSGLPFQVIEYTGTTKEQLFKNAMEAWDKAEEEYEPSDEELRAEYELMCFVDGIPR